MPKIIFVPTSHIAKESLDNVRKIVSREKPDCIALELDENRYYALRAEEREHLSKWEMLRSFGVFTFLIFWILKKLQRYFGGKTGILPGSEMLSGVEIAKEMNIPYALIDQPIERTFFEMNRVPFREKAGLFWMLIKAMVGLIYPFGEKVELDLNRVPSEDLIDEAMHHFRKELPTFYEILVERRNKYMVRNLNILGERFDKIVCIIGAGHEKGMKELLHKRDA